MPLSYRFLTSDEWPLLAEFCGRIGYPVPVVEMAEVVAAIDENGTVQGILPFQMCFHAEPFLVSPERTQTPSLSAMLTVLNERLVMTRKALADSPEPLVYYAFVQDTPPAHAVAEKNGMTPMHGLIPYKREILP